MAVRTRVVRLELPEMSNIEMPHLGVAHVPHTLPYLLIELSKHATLLDAVSQHLGISPFDLCRTLGDSARLMEALRLGLIEGDVEQENREQMTEGEIALLREQKITSGKLSTIISLMEKAERRNNLQPTANPKNSRPTPDHNKKG